MTLLKQLLTLLCKRCGHTWTPRALPVYLCPRCHSPKWDVEPTPAEREALARRRAKRQQASQ